MKKQAALIERAGQLRARLEIGCSGCRCWWNWWRCMKNWQVYGNNMLISKTFLV